MANGFTGPDEAFPGLDITGVAPSVATSPTISINDFSLTDPVATVDTPFGTVSAPSVANMGVSSVVSAATPGFNFGILGPLSFNPIGFIAGLIADQIFSGGDAQVSDADMGGLLGGQVAPAEQPAIGPEFGLISAPQTDVDVSPMGDIGDFGGMSAEDAASIGMGADAGW